MPLQATRQAARRAAHRTTTVYKPLRRIDSRRAHSTQDAAPAPSSEEALPPHFDTLNIFISKTQGTMMTN